MENKKVLFVGPVGAGKTSAIQAASDIECVNTEAKISAGKAAPEKSMTTVAIDYGQMTLDNGDKVHLYGAPGQQRFDFMWDMLSNEMAAGAELVVVMIDNAGDNPLESLKYYTNAFADMIAKSALLVAVTRSDVSASTTPEMYQECLAAQSLNGSVAFIDARERQTVRELLSSFVA